MTYDIMELIAIGEAIFIALVFVAIILNKDVLSTARLIVKTAKNGTGGAFDKAVAFCDADDDGDVDFEDLKFLKDNADVASIKAAVVAELKQLEYAEAGVAISPEKQKNTGLMFKEAVSQKSKEA